MDPTLGTLVVLVPLCFITATAYAMVGLGGGTGYLAIMTLVGVSSAQMASTALLLNIVVTGAALLRYGLAGRIRMHVFAPFLVAAVPTSFLGGLVTVQARVFEAVLCVVLVVVAAAMLLTARGAERVVEPPRKTLWSLGPVVGGLVGFLSGFLGIGGGVFLGPVVLFLKWAGTREVAAMNSLFILVVSAVGLAAHGLKGSISIQLVGPLAVAVLAGGLLGAHLGETRLRASTLKRVFAAIILIAAIKAGLSAAGIG